jgi:hypothetical protein
MATETPLSVGTLIASTITAPASQQSSGGDGDECANDYFPAEQGSSWEYTSTSGGSAPQSRTVAIVAEGDDGFTVEIRLSSGAIFAVEWSCRDGDLTQLTPTAVLSLPSGSAGVTSTNHSGVTLPADLDALPSWSESGGWSAGGAGGSFAGTYTFDNAAIGPETVAVPFDTIEAMKVESKAEGTLNGEPTPPCQITQWWAKDVGLVKQETTCTLGGQPMTEVVELISYDSP